MDLVAIWSCLVGLAILLYVILDGFSLGVALLFRSTRNEEERDILMGSIAPVWDANQTWLVFGGGALFVAFPLIYSVLFTSLYIPLLTFVFGLIFRGVTFEFRANATRKQLWNVAFFLGSLVAVVAQGLTLGGILSGTKVVDGRFAGGPFDWLNSFSVTVAMALLAGYILLGSTYLIIKTTGAVQQQAYRRAYQSAFLVLAFQILITIWTPLHYPSTFSNWISPPRVYFIWAFPLVGLLAFYQLIKHLKARHEFPPFAYSVVFFFAGYLALVTSIYPYVVPPSITFQGAAAQHETLRFTLWGAAIVLPLVLAYTAYSYTIFKGKVDKETPHY